MHAVSGEMVFCMSRLWKTMVCTGRGEEKVMRSSYLKSYESIGSEEGSASDAEVSSGGPSRAGRKRRDGRDTSKAGRRGAPDIGSGARAEKKKRRQRPSSVDESDSWVSEGENMSSSAEDREALRPRKGGGAAKGDRRRDRKTLLADRGDGMSSRAAEMLAKKTEILEKYRSRTHHGSGLHGPDDVSRESEMDSGDNGREEKASRGRPRGSGRHRGGSVLQRARGHHVDDSESEINFIMDMYDRTSLNNSLKDKMFEYLTQVGRKG